MNEKRYKLFDTQTKQTVCSITTGHPYFTLEEARKRCDADPFRYVVEETRVIPLPVIKSQAIC